MPLPLTSFVGRQREVADVTRLLGSARLVTLTGAGGCGKTRLAQQVAGTLAERFADGVCWVELGRLTNATLVASAVARAAQVAEQPGQSLAAQLLAHFEGKHLLLVLDNCEHLAPACAHLVQLLLQAPRLTILATSREPLDIPGEQRYPLMPLSLPSLTARPGELMQSEAVQLFADRARAVVPGFAVTPDNVGVIARICHHLDGLPLAIELASTRVSVLALEQIAARLADRFALLNTGSPGIEARHRTLRAAIDWSYDWLSAEEQAVLQQLALFVGGCDLDTAEAVCVGVSGPGKLLDVLSALVNKSLILVPTLHVGAARYQLLETIRDYAYTRLRASAEWAAAHERFLRYYVARAEAIAPKLYGHEQAAGLGWLDREHDNLRQALSWALESHSTEAGLRLANALSGFWLIRNHLEEGRLWLERLLAHAPDQLPLAARVKALTTAAFVAGRLNDAQAAQTYAQQAVDLCEAAGAAGKPALAEALLGLIMSAQAAEDFPAAYQLVEQALPLYREMGEPHLLSMVLRVGGVAATALGQYAAARALLSEGLAMARAAGDSYRLALSLNYLGDLARCEQDFAAARLAYEESLALLRTLGAQRDVAGTQHNLAHTCLHLGDAERAAALFRESLQAQQALENSAGVAEGLLGFAALAVTVGLPGAGARLIAAADAVRPPGAYLWPAERMEYEHYQARTRAVLSPGEFEAEAARSRLFSEAQAIEYALSLPLRLAASPRRRLPDDLTSREVEIVVMIARGQSNSEIAAALVLSKRTVEKHVANILSKLGFNRREQIVRWALENGLS